MIGQKIIKLRQQKGWSLDDLAERSGVPRTTLHNIEKGHEPSWSKVCKIADALGVSLDELRPDES